MVRNSTAGRNYEFLLFSSRSKLTCRTNNSDQGLINYMWEIWLHLATVKKNTHHLIDQYHSIRIYGLINLLSQMDGNYCLLHSRFPSETFLQNWTPFIISHLFFSFYLTALSWVATSFNVSFSCQISSKFLTILFFLNHLCCKSITLLDTHLFISVK